MMRQTMTALLPHRQRTKNDVLRTNTAWEATRSIVLDYFWLFHCMRVRGRHHIPAHGPVIFAPNHVSYYDPPLLASAIPYRVRFMAWEALFRVPGLRQLIEAYGAFPVKVKSADKGAIQQSLKLLRHGECLSIFPEGGRTATGELEPFEQGVARLALQTGATIVPVCITGGYEAWPRSRLLPVPCRPITLKFYPPIRIEGKVEREKMKQKVEEINAAIARPLARRVAAYQRLKHHRRRKK